ncbi:hypothetical protein B0T18DRAFT_330581 [Schizothecium vesticola]|uniref:Uncharacterized protein n=1 Tax=Schizothecium vesticola TaxID=314040 RepID=A0AA40EJD6_9PEZI|nr:hypothetical protein B0T18DRAFT_330581 [Schizothecium vesticola]
MFPTLARRMAQAAGKATTTNAATASSASSTIPSPSRLKKMWPPDFSKLSKQEQLHFEKRYKRRVSHIAQRPRWNKMIQLAQLTTITFVVVYSVMFMDWKDERQPFDDVRQAVWGFFGYDYTPTKKPRAEPIPEMRERSSTWK